MTVTKRGMESTGLKWNKKCAVIHEKRRQVEQGRGDMKIADLKPIESLDHYNHLERSTAILYVSRMLGGRGLTSVDHEYKNDKIKAAVKLYCNSDPTMTAVRSFEELAVQSGRHSIIKNAKK